MIPTWESEANDKADLMSVWTPADQVGIESRSQPQDHHHRGEHGRELEAADSRGATRTRSGERTRPRRRPLLDGVGPSMALGSQPENGIKADLPAAAINRSKPTNRACPGKLPTDVHRATALPPRAGRNRLRPGGGAAPRPPATSAASETR